MKSQVLEVSSVLGIDLDDASFIMKLISQRPNETFDFYLKYIRNHIEDITSNHYILLGLAIGVRVTTDEMTRQFIQSTSLCQRKN